MRKEISIGILAFVMNLVFERITSTPAFASGILSGLSLCFIFIGILPDSTYHKLKGWKNKDCPNKINRILFL